MKLIVLDQKTLGNDLSLDSLSQFGELISHATTSKEETPQRIKDAEVIITNKVVITKEHMLNAPNLKLICIAATGMNNVDLEAAIALNIVVKNVAGYSTYSVVQHTFSMMFYLLSKMSYYNQQVKTKAWSNAGLFTDISKPFSEIAGKKWGIIGLGTIGKEVAKVAETFGASVHYYSTSGQNLISDYHHSTLETLLSESDIISIHAPLNEQTLNLINHTNLSLLKDESILLNLGRGGIVNEVDLAKTLNSKNIYAGLDVLEKEPIDENNPLLAVNNENQILITPHIAWASFEARTRLLEGIVKNIQEFLEE